ncbi:MAG: threonine--tRNA ligase [Simkaniaceae bacterium]|nr:threonine--tRNA ligase [Simkaniaceae bacterium]
MMIKYQGKEIELEEGASGSDLVAKLSLNDPALAAAIKINGELRDFNHPLNPNDEVEILNFNDTEGKEVFWHTSAHVLAQAVLRLWPDAQPTIGPPIENGFYYDFANLEISEEDLPKIEKEIKKILGEKHKTKRFVFQGRDEAIKRFSDNPYKVELLKEFPDGDFTAYEQGEFFDLCRGPHLPNLGKIKAFKLMKTSGAYWRGNSEREMLTRIYGISFPDRKMLQDYLHLLQEAKKRDHRVWANKLNLFSVSEYAAGMPIIHPNGMIIWNRLLEFWRALHAKANYQEIKTPAMMSSELWQRSGHWDHYRENMYTCEIDEKEFAVKPMNCPGCMIYFGAHSHSYREFPLRIGEIGHVHRHELSGSLNGLFRVRSFHQDDAHVFMRPSQIKDEILAVLKLADQIYTTFGLEYHLELSTRPEKEKTIGTDQEWEVATEGLRSALEEWGAPYQLNEGDGAFYGPKIDLHVRDALGRSWQCGTIQLDMSLPQRFDLNYTEQDGSQQRPIMIHRALYGSIERFFAIIIEHFGGKFPLWLNPMPIRLICVADRHNEYAHKFKERVQEKGLLCDVDDGQESVSKKIRSAQIEQVGYMLTIGDQELENNTVTVRTRDNVVHGEMSFDAFIEPVLEEYTTRSLTSRLANASDHSK